MVEVFACELHVECTRNNTSIQPRIKACATCQEFTPLVQIAPSVAPRKTASVAVVIISHNYGRYLTDAVESVLSQTLRPAEIVIVDDASDDDTPAIAKQIADRRVRYIRIDARDVNQSRETGFNATKSEYLVFLDADDRLPEDYIASGLPHCENHQVAIVYGDMQHFGERSDLVRMPEFDRTSIHHQNFIHSASIVRRSALEAVDAFRDLPDMRRCHHHNDWALWRRVLVNGRLAAKQSAPLWYRQHGDNWLTKGLNGVPPYYDRAALWQEPVTIYVPLSGRDPEPVIDWLEQQTHPRQCCRLVLVDTSQDAAFHGRIREWAAHAEYRDIHLVAMSVGDPGLSGRNYRETEVRRDVVRAMWRIYDGLAGLRTEYILTLEDDVEPPMDAIERLMHGMDRDVFTVASPYRGRYGGWMAWDTTGHLVIRPKAGLQPTLGNGFGCTLMRRSVLQQWSIGPYQGTPDYDMALYQRLRDEGHWRALIDWDCRSVHAGLMPE